MKPLALAAVLCLAASPLFADDFNVDTSQFKLPKKTNAGQNGASSNPTKTPAKTLPLDLSSLTGGRVPGPSPDGPDQGPSKEQKVVYAALDELSRTNVAATVAFFKNSLAKRDAAGDEKNPDQLDIERAAAYARQLIRNGKVKISGITARDGASGSWSYSMTTNAQGQLEIEGDFKVPGVPQADMGERNASRLKAVDQWANSVLHETSHMLNSLLKASAGYALKPLSEPLPSPMTFKSRRFWNGLSPLMACPGGHQCLVKLCPNGEDCYIWNFPKNHGQSTDEKIACELSQAVCDAGACEGYKRVVDAGR